MNLQRLSLKLGIRRCGILLYWVQAGNRPQIRRLR